MRLAPEADHSLPSNVKIMNEWSYTSTPPVVQDDCTFKLSLASF